MIGDTAIQNPCEGQAAQRDDRFERLWQAHRQRVWRLVARLAGNVDAADDLTQEVSLRAYQGYAGFRRDSSFETWLYRIAVNVVLRYRERHPQPTISLDSSELETIPGESSAEPEAVMLQSALRPIVWAAINRLAPELRTTLILQVYEGLKYREIASVMNVSLEMVKYRRHQAMLRLREELEGYEV